MFSVGTFFSLQRCWWWRASICAMLTALTVPYGILLLVPYIFTWWYQTRTQNYWLRFAHLLPIFLLPAGWCAIAIYCWQRFNNPLLFLLPSSLSRTLTIPGLSLWQAGVKIFLPDMNTPSTLYYTQNFEHIIMHLLFFLLLYHAWRTLPLPWTLWMGSVWLFLLLLPAATTSPQIWADQRIMLALFPATLSLTLYGKRSSIYHEIIIISCMALHIIFCITFFLPKVL